jgi:hypothetical protein
MICQSACDASSLCQRDDGFGDTHARQRRRYRWCRRDMRKTIFTVVILALAWLGYTAWPLYDIFVPVRAFETRDLETLKQHIRDLEADAVEIRMRATRRLDQMRQAQAATIGLNQGAVPGKTGLKANPVLDPRPTLASQGIDKVARAPGPPARPAIGRGFGAKDRGGTGLGRPCFSPRRPRDRLGIGQAMALGQSEDALPCPPGGRFSRPPTRLWPATIGDAPYGAVSVFADEKSAVMRHRHADRARPNRGIINDEAGHEVFIFAGRHPIPQARSD